jgi:hypothetical protein
LLQGAAEVELELLGLQESVELLAGVACLDGAEISPVCLEIAQLCGRLPLCLSIVGNLIKVSGCIQFFAFQFMCLILCSFKEFR